VSETNRPPPRITRRNLGSDVYGILWDRILQRGLHPGEKLSDLRISDELGVSRTPVREALHRLVQDGVVNYSPNRGFFVAEFSPADISEIFELRAALEGLALRNVARKLPASQFEWAVSELDRVEAMIAAAETDDERYTAAAAFLEVDQGFHQWLVNQSGNVRLIAIVGGLWAQVAVFQRAGTHIPGWIEIAIDQHRRIITILLEGRIEQAAQALEDHILDMRRRVLADIAPTLAPGNGHPHETDADDGPDGIAVVTTPEPASRRGHP
jgi:DNA-binding GntR family transcriptional regulator